MSVVPPLSLSVLNASSAARIAGFLLVGWSTVGCSKSQPQPGSAVTTERAALSATLSRTLGFESLSDWHVFQAGPRIELSSLQVEGSSSLALWNGNWMEVESRKLTKELPAPSVFGFEVRVPSPPTNPAWLGDAALYIHAPSVGANNEFVGTVSLTRAGEFVRVEFPLSASLKAKLNQNYSDLQFRIAINAPNGTAQPYRIDRLTFGKLCTPVSDGNTCTADVCEDNVPVSKPLPAGTNCDNGNLCDGIATCSASATCVPGTPPVVDDGNPCTLDTCVPATGVQHAPAPDGTACNDGNACTRVDGCRAGSCAGSSPVACAPENRCHPAGTCDRGTGTCDYPADETSCARSLTVRVPPGMSYRAFGVVASGRLDLGERVAVKGAIANLGDAWTHIANDAALVDVYTKPAVTIGERTVLQGMLRTGATASVASSAVIKGGSSTAFFEPPAEHVVTFDMPVGVLPDVVVDADGRRSLAPGGYGHLLLRRGSRLDLSSGDYYFDHFDTEAADAFVDSAFALNERAGAVRIFVKDPFTFRGSVSSTSHPPELLLAVLGSGTVRVERPFAGAFLAPEADLTLATPSGALQSAVFVAKNVTVNAGVVVKPLPRQPAACHAADFRRASAAACSGYGVEVVGHEGVTRAIFEGEESFITGKRVEPIEDFTFHFDRAVSLGKAQAAVQILSASCPESVLPAGCTHEVMLEASLVGTDGKTVRFSNENDPFLPGCRYKLRIDTAPLTGDGQCLTEPRELSFLSLSSADGSALKYEASELRTDPHNHEIAGVEFKDGIVWQADEFFRERAAALGLRPGIDGFVADGKVALSTLWPDAEVVSYHQQIGGVPLAGTGYTVRRERVTGRLLNITGHVEKGLTPPPSPSVSESAALAIAKAEVPGVATTSAPAKLELQRTYSASQQFRLAYRFVLTDSEHLIRRRVDVDALTGTVINSVDGTKSACTSVDVSTLVTPDPRASVPITLDTLQKQHGYGDPTKFNVGEYTRTPGGSKVYALDAPGGAPVYGVPLGRPSVHAECPGESYPNVVELPGDISDSSWDPATFTAAQLQLAAGSCLDYFANRPKPFGPFGAQWSGWDFQGLEPIDIRLDSLKPSDNAYYQGRSGGGPFMIFSPFFSSGAMIDAVCHEFTHGIWDHFGLSGTDPEAQSLDEGVADIFGSAAEYAARGDESSLWCMYPNDIEADCTRRLDAPAWSDPPQPSVYHGPNYCNPGDCPDRPHNNASILTYWFYLVARGGSAVGELGCGQTVEPIDPDPRKAVDMATEILFAALSENLYVKDGGFWIMANATIAAAQKLYPGAPAETVTAAWHAVNVWENAKDDPDQKVGPSRGESLESSWVPFARKLDDGVAQMDIQIDINDTFDSFKASPGDPGSPLVSKTVPTTEVPIYPDVRKPGDPPIGMDTYGFFKVALAPQQKYFWRSRPHSSDAWSNCEPISWFTTGKTPSVTRLIPPFTEVAPGEFTVSGPASQPTAVSAYKFQLSERNTRCLSKAGVDEQTVDPLVEYLDDLPHYQPDAVATFDDLQPEHDYWLNVLPLGPDDPDGNPGRGSCYAKKFRTLALQAPTDLSPSTTSVKYFGDPPELRWTAAKGTHFHRVRLYPIDEAGDCDYETIAYENEIDAACDGEYGCGTTLSPDIVAPRNATGYCWDVTGISTDRHESASTESRFSYYLGDVKGRSPGVHISETQIDHNPSPLPGNSYDRPVNFAWEAMPGVLGYMLRVGSYPWDSRAIDSFPYWSDLEPSAETWPAKLVTGNSFKVDGEFAARGRYCWTIWPVLEDPNQPGEIWSRQPQVDKDLAFCYTSGPAPPKFTFFHPPALADHIVAGETIEGQVTFQYAPDAQARVTSPQPSWAIWWDTSRCKQRGPYFRDLYDCVVGFKALAIEGTDFNIKAETFNSPVINPTPPPPFDELARVHDAPWTIQVDPCGGSGEACCDGVSCDNDKLGCDDATRTCGTCGARGDICCSSNTCKGAEDVCVNEGDALRCRQCGHRGQQCCDRSKAGFDCMIGEGPCSGGFCAEAPTCTDLSAVDFTGPPYAGGTSPHYGDENAAPQLGCNPALDGYFGEIGPGKLITWNTPTTGQPSKYLLTYWPDTRSTPVVGTVNGTLPPFVPIPNPCGVIGVTIQAMDGCGHLSEVGDKSVMYVKWK